jgi:hypothetical protein
MLLEKINNPQEELIVGCKYLYKAWGVWYVGTCETPYPTSPNKKALCNFTFASLTATESYITDIYKLPN